jgi:hypothetical protein
MQWSHPELQLLSDLVCKNLFKQSTPGTPPLPGAHSWLPSGLPFNQRMIISSFAVDLDHNGILP